MLVTTAKAVEPAGSRGIAIVTLPPLRIRESKGGAVVTCSGYSRFRPMTLRYPR
jgi:hypothetical protein